VEKDEASGDGEEEDEAWEGWEIGSESSDDSSDSGDWIDVESGGQGQRVMEGRLHDLQPFYANERLRAGAGPVSKSR